MQRALKVANSIMDSNQKVALFVEILNKYLYFFDNHCESVRHHTCSILGVWRRLIWGCGGMPFCLTHLRSMPRRYQR